MKDTEAEILILKSELQDARIRKQIKQERYDRAIDNLDEAIQILEKRIDVLEGYGE